MKRKYPTVAELRGQFGDKKEIPAKYEEEILTALSHFPELRGVKIKFRLVHDQPQLFRTEPSRVSLLAPAGKRGYTVTITEQAAAALEPALMKNLPHEARIAAIAHELGHIVQYEKCKTFAALKMAVHGTDRSVERESDICVIEHGLGFELYIHASYLSSVPGLLDVYRHADVNRLNPNEILEALPPDQLHDVHRF